LYLFGREIRKHPRDCLTSATSGLGDNFSFDTLNKDFAALIQITIFYFGLSESKSSVTKELFVKLFCFFFITYYVGIAVIARCPRSGISSELFFSTPMFKTPFTASVFMTLSDLLNTP
jgi:hypothetical protein